MTKTKELRELNLDELEQKLVEAKHELFNLRFQVATGKQDNSARLGQVRREIARIATLLREREIEAAEAARGDELMADRLIAAESTPERASRRLRSATEASRPSQRGRWREAPTAEAPDSAPAPQAQAPAQPSRTPRGRDAPAQPAQGPGGPGAVGQPWTRPPWSASSSGSATPATPRRCSGPSGSTPTTRTTTCASATGSASPRPGRMSKLKRWRVVEVLERAK